MTPELQSFVIFLVVTGSIVAIAVGITLYSRYDARRRLESMRRRYTGETTGAIVRVDVPANKNRPTIITATYQVDGTAYTIREHLKYTAPGTETGGFFITVKKVPALGEIAEGTPVHVVYQPDNPKYAMLADNEGVMEL